MNKRFFNQQNLTRRLRLLSVLFAMLLMPLSAWAVDYDIIVGGVQVTSDNAANIFDQDYATASYDNASNTLTLKGVHYDDQTSSFVSIGSSLASLTVHLVGYNQVGYDAEKLFSSTNACTVNITTDATVPGKLQYYGESSGMTDNNVTLNFGTSGLALDGTNIEATSGTSNICYFGIGMLNSGDPQDDYPYFVYSMSTIWYFSNAARTNENDYYPPTVNSSAGTTGYVSRMKTSGSAIIKSLTFQYVPVSGGTINVALTSLDGRSTYATGTLANGLVTLTPTTPVSYDDVCLTFTSESAFSFVPLAVKIIELESYDITVAGVQVTSDNASNITGDNITGTVSYDAENKILTLTNATIIPTTENAGIVYEGEADLTISLIGTNMVKGIGGCPAITRYNVSVVPNLTFTKGDTQACSVQLEAQGETVIDVFTNINYDGLYRLNNSSGEGTTLINTTTFTSALPYDLWIGTTQVTSDNAGNVLGDGKVSFTENVGANVAPTYTLTLNDATLTAPIKVGLANLTIDIQGTNSITTADACIQNVATTFVPSLTFTSTSAETGSLTLTDTDENGTNGVISSSFYSNNTSYFTINKKLALVLLRYGNYSSDTYYFSAGEVHNAQLVPSYGVQVNDMQVYEGNATNVLGDGKVSFDKSTNTLTLDNANGIEGISTTLSTLNIDLIGSNSLYRESNGSIFESASGEAVTINLKSTNATGTLTMEAPSNYGATLKGNNVTLTPVDPMVLLSSNEENNKGTLVYGVNYGLTVAGVTVSNANASNVLGGETATVVFTPADNTTSPATLTLNGATIAGSILSGLENLRVVINGTNTAVQVLANTDVDGDKNITFAGGTNGGTLTIDQTGGVGSAVSEFASVSYDGAYPAADVPFGYGKPDSNSPKGYVKSHMMGDNSYLEALTITTVPHYPIWLYTNVTTSTQVDNTNKNTLLGASGDISFDGNHTLSLKNSVNSTARIVSGLSELTISVDGDCIIESPDSGSVVRSINSAAPLTIEKASGASSASLKLATVSKTAVKAFASLDYTGLILLSKGATYTSGALNDSDGNPLNVAIFTSSLKKPTLRMYYPDVDNFSGNPYYKFVNPNGGGTVKYSRFFASESINDDINQTYNDGTFDVMIDSKWAPVVCKVWVEANGSVSDTLYACRLDVENMEATYGDTNVPAPTLLPQTVDGVTTTYALRDPDNETHHANIASDGTISLLSPGQEWLKATFTVGDGVEYIKNASDEVPSADFYIVVKPSKPTLSHETGSYVGTQTVTFTDEFVDNQNITAWYYTYEGEEPADPTVNPVPDGGIPVSSSENVAVYYQLGYDNGDNSTLYAYSETTKIAITILEDINNCTVTGNDNVTYTGAAQTPTITVTPDGGGEALVLGTDYTVSYKKGETAVESMIDAGDYTIVITAKEGSAYGGTKEVGFTIAQAKLSAVTIAAIDDQTFTGSQITPAVTVTFNEKTVSTEEYNVVYGENKNVGEGAGTVTLTSKNKNFVTSTDADATTKQTATFNIVAATAAITAIDQTVTFDGEEKPFTNYTIANGTPRVTYYSSEEARTAQSGGTTSAPTEAAIYYVQVTQGDDNYTSAPANATFTISPKTLTSEMVTLSATSFVYSGAAQTPDVTVADGDNILTINTNYDYVIKQGETVVASPMNVGSYSVVVTGKGNYSGTATQTFTIAAKDLASATVTVDATQTYTYTGAAIEPNVSSVSIKLTEGADVATNLTAGTDYTVTGYANNTDAALATAETNAPTVTITGKGNFTGTATVTFTIAQAKLSAVTIAAIGNQTFTGSQITPGVTVTFNEKTVSTDEYNVVYGDNINAGENAGTVTLTSKNKNFVTSTDEDATTKKTATFNIVAATAAITATDQTVTFNGGAQKFTNYTIANGEAAVTYYSSEEARAAQSGGTTSAPTNAAIYYVQVTQGDDNYTSAPANATFTIRPKALTEGMVEQDGVSFTYSGYTPEYSVSVKDGEEYLAGDDYDCVIKQGGTEIIPVNAGSYDVVVTGKRNYTGTITKTLTITKAQLTVTPDDKTYNVGDNIELTVSYDGFVDGDDEDVLTTEPTASYGTADVTKPGSYEITASGGVAQNYDFIYGTGTLTINRQLTVSFSASNTWATYCGTENLSTPEGLKAYQVTAVEGATVTISEIGYIPANTAVLLKNVSNNNTWSNIAASAYTGATSTFENNKLIGTASAVDVSTISGGTVYVLYNNMFKRATGGTIPANRGYLVVAPSSGNAPELSITIGDDTTGIGTVGCDSVATDNDEWYSIDGVKLNSQPQKPGLYIKNGKKVFINKK